MKKGYYVITEKHEIWCHNLACAKQTKKEEGGRLMSVEEYNRRAKQKREIKK